MAFNPNDHTLAQNFDKLDLRPESKYDEEILDEAIVNGMKGEHKAFCLKIENLLNQYMAGQKVPEVIPDLDKYQRKIVHKICDLYNIKRDYVDVKTDETGSITISRTETSFMPTMSLEERYKKHLKKIKKQAPAPSSNPFSNKKVMIKTRSAQADKKSASDKNESNSGETDNSQTAKSDVHDEVEHKKKKEYEEARDRIMQDNEAKQIVVETPDPNNPNKVSVKTKKKGRFEGYDPDYDRFRSQQNEGYAMNNNMGPIGLVPGMGMPNMYPMHGMPMPGMGGMPNMPGMGYYPPPNQAYIPFPTSFPNPNFPPNVGPYNNYGPQFQGGNQQFQSGNQQFQGGNQQSNPAPTGIQGGQGGSGNIGSGAGGGSGAYFQNFPTLGRDANTKNK